jgi:hypothetical protein
MMNRAHVPVLAVTVAGLADRMAKHDLVPPSQLLTATHRSLAEATDKLLAADREPDLSKAGDLVGSAMLRLQEAQIYSIHAGLPLDFTIACLNVRSFAAALAEFLRGSTEGPVRS